MDLGWSTAIQALIIAFSTVVVRVLAKKDKEDVKKNTSSPGDVERVRRELHLLRDEFDILKTAYFKANPASIDHRGPAKG
jgi:hypothetical protein